jgi:hypothetical protein
VWYINDNIVRTETIPSSEIGGKSSLPFVAPFDSVNNIDIKVVLSDGRLSTEQGWKFNITTVSNTAPTAEMKVSPKLPKKGKPVSFDGSASHDPENDIISYEWRFSDGTTMSGKNVTKTYNMRGIFSATLTVTDSKGNTDSTTEVLSFGGSKVQSGAQSPLSMVLFVILLVVMIAMLIYQANRKGWLAKQKEEDLGEEYEPVSPQDGVEHGPASGEKKPEDGPAIEGGFEELPVEEED